MHQNNIVHTNICKNNIIKFNDCYKLSNLKRSLDIGKIIPDDYNIYRDYMQAPEMFESSKSNISLAVDIWSFGILF